MVFFVDTFSILHSHYEFGTGDFVINDFRLDFETKLSYLCHWMSHSEFGSLFTVGGSLVLLLIQS